MSPKNRKKLLELESQANTETDSRERLLDLVPLEVKRRVLAAILDLERLGEPITSEALKPRLSPDDWTTLQGIFGKDICE